MLNRSVTGLTPECTPQNVLVLARAATHELFQILAALRSAKERYPQIRLFLQVDEKHIAYAEKITFIEHAFITPPDQIWDFIINWSTDPKMAEMAERLNASKKLGKIGASQADGWSRYMEGAFQLDLFDHRIHRIDCLTTQILTALLITCGEGTFAQTPFFGPHEDFFPCDASKKIITILAHPQDNDSWPCFAELLESRHPDWEVFFLTSTSHEEPSRLRIISTQDPAIWLSLLQQSQWVCSQEHSAATLLASLLGTRTLLLTLSPDVYPLKNLAHVGPYGDGHYAMTLTSREPAADSAYLLYGLWSYASNEWAHERRTSLDTHFLALGWPGLLERASSIVRSRIQTSSEGGGVVYERIDAHLMGINEWMSQVTAHTARSWYCGWAPEPRLDRKRLHPELIHTVRDLRIQSQDLRSIYEQECIIYNDLLAGRSGDLTDLLRQKDTFRQQAPLLTFFLAMEQIWQRALPTDIEATACAILCREAALLIIDGLSVLELWCEATISHARPQPLASIRVLRPERNSPKES